MWSSTLHSILLFQNPRSSHNIIGTLFLELTTLHIHIKTPQKLSKMVAATTTALKILDYFIISLDPVPKMKMLDLLFPS